MAEVDPDDDDIWHYVVRRYASDPERHERRHQVVSAFDDEREGERLLDRLSQELQRRRAVGEVVDPREHDTAQALEPGHRRRQQDGRLLRQAIAHGADVSGLLDRLDLPPNIAVLTAERREQD